MRWTWKIAHLLAVSAVGITGTGLVIAAAAGQFRLTDRLTKFLPDGVRNVLGGRPHVDPVQFPEALERSFRTAAPKPSPQGEKPETFGIGSSEADVRRLQGRPERVAGSTWFYGRSEVHFVAGRVVSWTNSSLNPLRVR